MIRFITEHKDQRVPRVGGDAGPGLRWGVEPMCAVLTEHGIKISPATYYEWVNAKPALHNPGCSCGLNPPDSSSDLAM